MEPLRIDFRLPVEEGQPAPDGLGGRPAEEILTGRVPQHNEAVFVKDIQGQQRARNDQELSFLGGPLGRVLLKVGG